MADYLTRKHTTVECYAGGHVTERGTGRAYVKTVRNVGIVLSVEEGIRLMGVS